MSKNPPGLDRQPGEAAEWFVRIDRGSDLSAEAALTAWLGQPANERSWERVELAIELSRRLAADSGSALHAEAAAAARPPRLRRCRRALAWGGALAATSLVAVIMVPEAGPPPAAEPLRAARLVAVDAPSNPVAVLPNGVVVDASSVAVLPFVGAGDRTLANGLERDVASALRSVPGLYVVADAAVSSYAHTDLGPADIGAQLGARGIVDAAIVLAEGRVRVNARLRDAATGATLWHAELDRPIDELRAVRNELAEQIAAAMFDSSLRAQVARVDGAATAFAAKPFQQ